MSVGAPCLFGNGPFFLPRALTRSQSIFLTAHYTAKHTRRHSECPEVMVWNTQTQPDRDGTQASSMASCPDLVLIGHERDAEYALDVTDLGGVARAASGGSDRAVLTWDLKAGPVAGSSGSPPSLSPIHRFQGHTRTVEDCCFGPVGGGDLLCSCGGDRSLLFWDARAGPSAVASAPDAHEDDANCCAWSALEPK